MSSRKPLYAGGIHYPGTGVMETDPTMVQSAIFEEFYGAGKDVLDIRQVNLYADPVYGHEVPVWTVVLTDLIQQSNDAGTGLVNEAPGNPNEKRFVTSIRKHAIPALMNPPDPSHRAISIITGDRHLNPDEWNLDALTKYPIYWEQLHPEERAVVNRSPELSRKLSNGAAMTLGEYFKLIGEVLSDKEDFNFIPHARDHLMKYIHSLNQMVVWSAEEAIAEKGATGRANPAPYVYLDYKSGLNSLALPNEYGAGGNNFYNLLRGIYRERYQHGKWHRGHKVLVVGGTAPEYSLRLLLEMAADLDFFVVWALYWSDDTMGIDSAMNTVDFINSRYGRKVLPTFDWLPEHMFGPKPSDFDLLAQSYKAELVMQELGDMADPELYDLYMRMQDKYARIVGQQDAIQIQIDDLVNRRKYAEADALRLTMPQVPFLLERAIRELAQKNSRGGDMFWSMNDITTYLREGGE